MDLRPFTMYLQEEGLHTTTIYNHMYLNGYSIREKRMMKLYQKLEY